MRDFVLANCNKSVVFCSQKVVDKSVPTPAPFARTWSKGTLRAEHCHEVKRLSTVCGRIRSRLVHACATPAGARLSEDGTPRVHCPVARIWTTAPRPGWRGCELCPRNGSIYQPKFATQLFKNFVSTLHTILRHMLKYVDSDRSFEIYLSTTNLLLFQRYQVTWRNVARPVSIEYPDDWRRI